MDLKSPMQKYEVIFHHARIFKIIYQIMRIYALFQRLYHDLIQWEAIFVASKCNIPCTDTKDQSAPPEKDVYEQAPIYNHLIIVKRFRS